MVGRVRHAAIFSAWTADAKFLRFLAKVKDRTTTSLLATLADFFAAEGIEIIDSTFFLKEHLVAAKNYTPRLRLEREPWPETSNSAGKRPGASPPWTSARPCASRTGRWSPSRPWKGPIAPSSRAAEIAGAGLVVVKVSRPGQDMRFDVPVVGLRTMDVLEECRAAAFVLEAGKTLMLDQPQVLIARARQSKIVLLGKT